MPLLRRTVREQSYDPLRRRDRQPAAFAPEMGLVGVAGFHRETSRRAIAAAAQEFEEALKSQDAVECLGPVSECRVEAPAQGPFAQRELPGEPGDQRFAGRRAGREQLERRVHIRQTRRNRRRAPRQRALDRPHARADIARLARLCGHAARIGTPERLQRDAAVDGFGRRQSQPRGGRRGAEAEPTTVAPAASRSILGARSGPAIRKAPSIHSRSIQPSGTTTTGCTSGLGN